MLTTVEIKAFRCFQDLKVSGLSRVNLIGGKNNSGKTAFLEAILLLATPPAQAALTIKESRRESVEVLKALPERAWDTFFFNRQKHDPIELTAYQDGRVYQEITISFEDAVSQELLIKHGLQDPDFLSTMSGAAALNFQVSGDRPTKQVSLVASSRGFFGFGDQSSSSTIPLIPSGSRTDTKDLTTAYDRARLDDKEADVLQALQILDPAIVDIESFSVGEPTLYLTRTGQARLPIAAFGDAVNRIADIILKLINNEHKVMLIDEIENGIHYSSQVDFWRLLIELTKKLNVQIFATTHSLEMIRAFATAGLALNPLSCAYLELARHETTGKIIAIHRDLESLDYALERGKGVRGE